MTATIEVLEPGIATTVQDRGRPGFAHLGVPRSGAVDTPLAALTNRLVGNDSEAAVIETCGGFVFRVDRAALIASSIETAPRSMGAGEVHRIGGGSGRLWHYVAVRGGIDVAPVLGSRSTDTLSGLGPPPLEAGTRLAVGPEPGSAVVADHAPLAGLGQVVRIAPGPRLDWFEPGAMERLASTTWTVTSSNRIGVRLTGLALPRRVGAELPSEGLVLGAIQIPPDGDPVVMLADHPTTGGYPVIAVVHPDDVAVVAQTAPGHRLRLIPS